VQLCRCLCSGSAAQLCAALSPARLPLCQQQPEHSQHATCRSSPTEGSTCIAAIWLEIKTKCHQHNHRTVWVGGDLMPTSPNHSGQGTPPSMASGTATMATTALRAAQMGLTHLPVLWGLPRILDFRCLDRLRISLHFVLRPASMHPMVHTESQNGWVGRDLKDHEAPTPHHRQGHQPPHFIPDVH